MMRTMAHALELKVRGARPFSTSGETTIGVSIVARSGAGRFGAAGAALPWINTGMFVQHDEKARGARAVWALDDGLAIAMHDSLCISVWRGDATLQRLDLQASAFAHLTTHYPRRALVLAVLEPGRPPPPDYLRKRIFAMLDKYGSDFMGFACVIEGSGFTASINRAVFQSIEAFGGGFRFPMYYCATYSNGIAWLDKRKPLDAVKIGATVDHLRAQLKPHF